MQSHRAFYSTITYNVLSLQKPIHCMHSIYQEIRSNHTNSEYSVTGLIFSTCTEERNLSDLQSKLGPIENFDHRCRDFTAYKS